MQVGIIGVGLIGGSMAVDLKNRGFADRVVGVEADALHASAAKELRLSTKSSVMKNVLL